MDLVGVSPEAGAAGLGTPREGAMRDVTATQRRTALRRVLDLLASPPRWLEWARERRVARLDEALARALPLDAELAPDGDGHPRRGRPGRAG
jgi:hypothetical protein